MSVIFYLFKSNNPLKNTCRCGTFSTALCGDAGCADPGTGDYDVLIPADQPVGKCYSVVFST